MERQIGTRAGRYRGQRVRGAGRYRVQTGREVGEVKGVDKYRERAREGGA